MTTDQQAYPQKRSGTSKILLLVALSILSACEAYFGYRMHALSLQQAQIKEDYSTLNSITFGLFSINQWRDKIAGVVDHQVTDFQMTAAQKKELQKQVEDQLHSLVSGAIAQFNKPQKTIGGRLKKFAFNKIVDEDQVQAQVPAFANTIITRINSPASIKRLKGITTSKLNELEAQTYDSSGTATAAVTASMFKKYKVATAEDFNKKVTSSLASLRAVSYKYAFAMLACVLAALGLFWLLRKQVHLHTSLFVVLLLIAIILLTVGATASVVEVDARIKTLNFVMLGEKVGFDNQVLFFQSQSILNIVETLMNQPKADAIVVGILILVFVLLFPVLKLIATGIHILSPDKIAESKLVRYFAFQSGKWNMADVMVVGILMTYIGLNGILESQLSNLVINSGGITSETINYTSLQPGYFIFAGFVVYNIILFAMLKRMSPRAVANKEEAQE